MIHSANKLEAVGMELLPVIAYGDAAGLPFEAGEPLPMGSVRGLEPLRSDFLEMTNQNKGRRGIWSDDTHQSEGVMKSLVARDGFSMRHQAEFLVESYLAARGTNTDPDWHPPITSADGNMGWGKGTIGAVERLMDGVSPNESGTTESSGNGALIKLAPLVYWNYALGRNHRQSRADIVALTNVTHDTPEATVASLVHADVLARCLNPYGVIFDHDGQFVPMYRYAVERAHYYETSFDFPPETSAVLDRLNRSLQWHQNPSRLRDDILTATPYGGFRAAETLLRVYGSFMIEHKFPDSVYRAVELGGDSDSVASIVGTMSLFLAGEVTQPKDMKEIYYLDRLRKVSRAFTAAAMAAAEE